MSVKLLTEHHLELLSLKGGCTGSSESILVKMPHCWKSHVMANLLKFCKKQVKTYNFPIKNSKGADQTLRMHRLVSAFIVCIQQNQLFASRPKIYFRPLGKSAYQKINFLISQPKHMLWVLKRTVSMRRFF